MNTRRMSAAVGVICMIIDLYTCSADRRKLNKSSSMTAITGLAGLSCAPTDRVNMITPEFVIDYNSTYLSANYLYCRDFDRYYFISNPRFDTAGRIVLPCVIDVRMTAHTKIAASECIITRAESIGQPTQIIDSKLPVNPANKIITSILLPETSDSLNTDAEYSYLLTVIGGAPSI